MSAVKVLTQANFQDQIAEGVTLVDFWAPWCGPCKIQLPIFDELAEELKGRVTLAKVNVDEELELSSRFGIMSIPTLAIFKDGEMKDMMIGLQRKDVLKQKLALV